MYKAQLNNKKERSIQLKGNNTFSIEGRDFIVDSFQDKNGLITVTNGQARYKVRIQNVDFKTKTFHLRLNGIKHRVQISDKFDLLLDELGFDSRGAAELNQVKAPMPGLILEVNVSPGTQVKNGDKLLVLEAMKMENVIKSPGEGIVKEIKVNKGDSVEKNQVMIQF